MPEPPYIQESDGTIRQGRSVRPAQVRVIDVPDRDLSYIRIDHQTRLQLGATEVVVESPFELSTAGQVHRLDPEDRAGLGPLLALYPGTLVAMTVDDDGTLRLELADGSTLVVPPDPRYEAWQVSGPGRRLVVCSAGGSTLAVWPQSDDG